MAKQRHSPARLSQPLVLGCVLALVWSSPAVVSTAAIALAPASAQASAWPSVLLVQLVCWYFWIPVTPVVWRLGRSLPLESGRLARRLAIHGLGAAALCLPHAALSALAAELLATGVGEPAGSITTPGQSGLIGGGIAAEYLALLPGDIVIYAAIGAAGYALDYHRRWQAGELATSQLATKLTRAQLQALKMQLHPHFLFNTLHAIGVLVRKRETRGALRMLIGLSDLLRTTLDHAGKQVVPLRQEIDFLHRYIKIERVRFGGQLDVTIDVEPSLMDAIVPHLALQPLLENAIRHGIAPRHASGSIAGSISVTVRRDGDGASERLRIEVRDDGIGLAENSAELSGMGLANVRARLDQLYSSQHHFEIADREDGEGVVAIIEIPLSFDKPVSS